MRAVLECPYCHCKEGEWHKPDCESTCPGCGVAIGFMHKDNCAVANSPRIQYNFECYSGDPKPMLSRQRAADLLKHTEELINGERAKDYGEPQESFEKIAKLWSTYLGSEISVTDVGIMMILLKVARNGRGRNKPDNFVDICGYASLTGSEVFNANSK